MTYHPFFMWISSSNNCLKLFSCFFFFFQVIKLCLCWVIGNFIMRTYEMACTSPHIFGSSQSVLIKRKDWTWKLKNWVQELHYEKVKIKRTVALIAVLCRCKLMLSVWSFVRHKNIKDVGIFIMLFWSLKTSNMFYSHRKLISNNASFFVAVLQWLHQLVQENENKYASQIKCIGLVFFFSIFYKQ